MEQPRGGNRRGRRAAESNRTSARQGTRKRYLIVTTMLLTIFALPAVALAAVSTLTFQETATTSRGPLLEAFDYQTGDVWSMSGNADLLTGGYDQQTTQALLGSDGLAINQLTLKPIGPDGVLAPRVDEVPWWDTNWNLRRCLQLDHTGAGAVSVTEYQIRVQLDVDQLVSDGFLQSDTADLRAVSADGTTQLPLWVNPQRDAVWIQVDDIAAGATQTPCLYFDHSAGGQTKLGNHSEEAVFTYTTPKPVYLAVQDRYGAGTNVEVAAYVDGTQFVLDAGPVQTLDAGELLSVPAVGPDSVISSTGPLSARALGDGFDTIVPISWATTSLVIPSERGSTQRLSFYAPFGNTTVTLYEGASLTPLTTIPIPANTAIWIEPPGDVINNESIVLESDLPVLVFHDWTDGRDSFAGVPFLGDEWFGVGSTRYHLGATRNGTHIDEFRSNSTVETDVAINRGAHYISANGGSQGGTANAGVRLVLDRTASPDPQISPTDAEFFAISQADSDGYESTSFWPTQELNSRYLIPTTSQYIVVSCPVPGTEIIIEPPTGAPLNMTCDGPGTVGWAKDTQLIATQQSSISGGVVTPGTATTVSSADGQPFFLYYENRASDDETNVLGMKQARQQTWPEPVVTSTIEGLFPEEGYWTSPEFSVPPGSNVFGEFDVSSTTPAGTTVEAQVATGNAPGLVNFVGPGGTTGTEFGSVATPEVLDFGHDGDSLVRVRIKLSSPSRTRTPLVEGFSLGHSLEPIVRSLATPSLVEASFDSVPNTETIYLLRIRTTRPDLVGSTVVAILDNVDAGLSPTALRMVNVATGTDVTQAGSSPPFGGPVPFDSSTSYSLIGDLGAAAAGQTLQLSGRIVVDINNGGVHGETDIVVEVTS